VIHAAPTKAAANYTQKTGRGTRLSPGTGKSDLLVIDLVDITKRHSLVTIADLVGLPPKFDFKGGDILEAAKKYEETKKQNQHLMFDDCQSLDDIQAKVEDVDLFIPEMPPVVKEYAELAWSQASPDHFQMSYHGEFFPERIDLKQDLLGQWSLEFSDGHKKAQKIPKSQPTREDAFKAAEKWMSVNKGRTYNMKRQNAPWRKGVPTAAQVREIRRQGLDVNWNQMTAGQVHDMLEFRKAQANARARARAGVEQCAIGDSSIKDSHTFEGESKPQPGPIDSVAQHTDPPHV